MLKFLQDLFICGQCSSTFTLNRNHPNIANGDWMPQSKARDICKFNHMGCPACGGLMFNPETLADQYTEKFKNIGKKEGFYET